MVTISHTVSNPSVFEQGSILVRLQAHAHSGVALLEILHPLPEGFEVIEGTNDNIVSLVAGERRGVTYELCARVRGRVDLGSLVVRIHGGDALVFWEETISLGTECLIYPNPENFRQPVRPFNTQVYSGNYPSRVGGEGIEFFDTRAFVPGVPMSRVNWRVTARTGALHVTEFVRERNADVVVLVDSFIDFGGPGPDRCIDFVARCAASLVEHFLQHKNQVGYVELGYFVSWVLPAIGKRQWYRILERLSDLDVRPRQVSFEIDSIPRRILPSNALVLALTSGADERFLTAAIDLQRRGYDVVTVVVPAERVLARHLPDQPDLGVALRMWQARIDRGLHDAREAGLSVVNWDIDESLELLVRSIEALRRRRVRYA